MSPISRQGWFFKLNFQFSNSQNAGKCKLGWFSLRQSHIMTRFGKMCIVHTSDFANLEIHKNHREWYLDVKLSGTIKE